MTLVNHVGISGGKDSTALLLWAVYESGYQKDSIRATFCDTGNEHEYTYEFVRYLSERVHPIEWLKPERDFYELARKKKRFPSPKARFCTTELKIRPSRDYVHGLVEQGCRVVLHTGVRGSESMERGKLPERDYDPDFLADVYRPLLSWSIRDVWEIHDRYGIAPNPLYGRAKTLPWSEEPNPFYRDGVMRVGCYPCIMSRKSEIRRIAIRNPERIKWIGEQEESVQSRCGFSSMFAMDKIPARFRSKEIVAEDGRTLKVCTINDVAKWAVGDYHIQTRFDFGMTEELPDEFGGCASNSGMCE